MNRRNWFLSGLLLVVLTLALVAPVGGAAQAQTPMSRVRFLHAVASAPVVDVYVDGTLAVEALSFGEVTPHLSVAGGDHQIEVRPSGHGADAPALLVVPVPLVPNLAFTVVVQGTAENLSASLYEDILDEIGVGQARLTAVNAVADSPALDVVTAEGGPLLQGVNFGSQFGTVNIGAGVQDLVMVPAGGAVESAVAELGTVALRSGMLYTFVAMGTLEGAEGVSAMVIETPVNGTADSVLVQVAHGSADAPAVDVYAGDTLLIPALEPGELTGHIAVPAGDYSLALRPAGAPAADAPVLTSDVSLSADTPAVTVMASGLAADESLALEMFPDDVAGMTPDQARLSVLNAIAGGEVTASFSDETVLASAVASNAQSDTVEVAPGNYMVLANVQGIENPVDLIVPEQPFVGGMYYTVLVFGGAEGTPYDASVSATPVDVTLGSLPTTGGAEMAAAVDGEDAMPSDAEAAPEVTAEVTQEVTEEAATPEAEPAATEAPADTAGESELVATGESEVVTAPQGTEAAQNTPAPIQPQAVPIAYVELDPGANLQCRELPGSDKRSLGLIPSGTTLTVIGRTGTPLVPETGNTTPEPTPDPASVEDLWLSVQWDTPGGGYLRCWVNAQFLRVEYRGRLLDDLEELWELPEEPFNRPGENASADVTPPTPLFDAVLATVELEPGVSLQLRRFPDSNAESLELVPALAQLEVLGVTDSPSEGFIGQPTSPYWLYVRYRTENGGATIGWVSAEYVSLARLGRPVEIADLPLVDVTEAGYYEAPGQTQIPLELQDVVGTVDLNPGANLNLRDRPDAQARVILGIPSGDSFILDGRNGDGSWVHAKYESSGGDVEGWTAAQYLIITRGGQPYDVAELPILTDEADTMEN